MKKWIIAISSMVLILTMSGCGALGVKAPGSTSAANGSISTDETAIGKFTPSLKSVAEKDFTLNDLNGKAWKLSDLKGKIVLLNFWATWCGPCQNEMPSFQKLFERFGQDGDVVVIAVASAALEQQGTDESKATVAAFVKSQKFTFPVLFDSTGDVWNIYQQEGIPANYIIDKEGNIRLLVSGAFTNEETMYAALEAVRRADSGQ